MEWAKTKNLKDFMFHGMGHELNAVTNNAGIA